MGTMVGKEPVSGASVYRDAVCRPASIVRRAREADALGRTAGQGPAERIVDVLRQLGDGPFKQALYRGSQDHAA